MSGGYGVILFHTTSASFQAEKALRQAGLVCKLIPTPREFSSDCGVAARFDWEQVDSVLETIQTAKVETAGMEKMK